MIAVFQIYFDAKSEQALDKAFRPYLNEIKDDYFENSVIAKTYKLEGADYIGVTSWKQNQKTHFTGQELIDIIEKDIAAGTSKDVYIYSPVQGIETTMDYSVDPPVLHGTIQFPDIWTMHKTRYDQLDVDNHLLNNSKVLPFDLFDGKWQFCHCNYWIAKKHVFDDYCEKVLLPAIDFYERPEIKAAMPQWYKHAHEGRMVNSACFTMEGLFGSFLAHNNYSFEYLTKKYYRRKYQVVKIDGYQIKNDLC